MTKETVLRITRLPSTRTVNGSGTVMYGNTRYFVIAFIPVLPLARYSVERAANGDFKSYIKLPFTTGQKLWVALVILAIPILLLVEFLYVNATNMGA